MKFSPEHSGTLPTPFPTLPSNALERRERMMRLSLPDPLKNLPVFSTQLKTKEIECLIVSPPPSFIQLKNFESIRLEWLKRERKSSTRRQPSFAYLWKGTLTSPPRRVRTVFRR